MRKVDPTQGNYRLEDCVNSEISLGAKVLTALQSYWEMRVNTVNYAQDRREGKICSLAGLFLKRATLGRCYFLEMVVKTSPCYTSNLTSERTTRI